MKDAKKQKFLIKKSDKEKRLDIFLSEKLNTTRSQTQKLIERDLVLVNEKLPKKAGERLRDGETIEVETRNWKLEISGSQSKILNHKSKIINLKSDGENANEFANVKVVAEAADYLVIEKPVGVLVHPTEAGETDTLISWLTSKYPEVKKVGDNPKRPGIIHRLDREASGLLVVARNQKMFEYLKKQFQDRKVQKEYLVLVCGKMEKKHGVIDFAIDRGKDGKMVSRPKVDLLKLNSMRSVQPGKEALTEFTVEKEYGRFSLLRVKIHTGRTHQIRVHLFAYNHPVVGDDLYFNRKLIKKNEPKLGRLFLHATKLCFEDLEEKIVCFESKLPEELEEYLIKI